MMTFVTESISDEPVFVVTYDHYVSAAEMLEAQKLILEYAARSGQDCIYAINDVRKSHTTFIDVMTNLKDFNPMRKEFEKQHPVRIEVIFVGSNGLLNLMMSMFSKRQNGGYSVLGFRTIEDAQHYIRLEQERLLNAS
jgi:hypothetical protein